MSEVKFVPQDRMILPLFERLLAAARGEVSAANQLVLEHFFRNSDWTSARIHDVQSKLMFSSEQLLDPDSIRLVAARLLPSQEEIKVFINKKLKEFKSAESKLRDELEQLSQQKSDRIANRIIDAFVPVLEEERLLIALRDPCRYVLPDDFFTQLRSVRSSDLDDLTTWWTKMPRVFLPFNDPYPKTIQSPQAKIFYAALRLHTTDNAERDERMMIIVDDTKFKHYFFDECVGKLLAFLGNKLVMATHDLKSVLTEPSKYSLDAVRNLLETKYPLFQNPPMTRDILADVDIVIMIAKALMLHIHVPEGRELAKKYKPLLTGEEKAKAQGAVKQFHVLLSEAGMQELSFQSKSAQEREDKVASCFIDELEGTSITSAVQNGPIGHAELQARLEAEMTETSVSEFHAQSSSNVDFALLAEPPRAGLENRGALLGWYHRWFAGGAIRTLYESISRPNYHVLDQDVAIVASCLPAVARDALGRKAGVTELRRLHMVLSIIERCVDQSSRLPQHVLHNVCATIQALSIACNNRCRAEDQAIPFHAFDEWWTFHAVDIFGRMPDIPNVNVSSLLLLAVKVLREADIPQLLADLGNNYCHRFALFCVLLTNNIPAMRNESPKLLRFAAALRNDTPPTRTELDMYHSSEPSGWPAEKHELAANLLWRAARAEATRLPNGETILSGRDGAVICQLAVCSTPAARQQALCALSLIAHNALPQIIVSTDFEGFIRWAVSACEDHDSVVNANSQLDRTHAEKIITQFADWKEHSPISPRVSAIMLDSVAATRTTKLINRTLLYALSKKKPNTVSDSQLRGIADCLDWESCIPHVVRKQEATGKEIRPPLKAADCAVEIVQEVAMTLTGDAFENFFARLCETAKARRSTGAAKLAANICDKVCDQNAMSALSMLHSMTKNAVGPEDTHWSHTRLRRAMIKLTAHVAASRKPLPAADSDSNDSNRDTELQQLKDEGILYLDGLRSQFTSQELADCDPDNPNNFVVVTLPYLFELIDATQSVIGTFKCSDHVGVQESALCAHIFQRLVHETAAGDETYPTDTHAFCKTYSSLVNLCLSLPIPTEDALAPTLGNVICKELRNSEEEKNFKLLQAIFSPQQEFPAITSSLFSDDSMNALGPISTFLGRLVFRESLSDEAFALLDRLSQAQTTRLSLEAVAVLDLDKVFELRDDDRALQYIQQSLKRSVPLSKKRIRELVKRAFSSDPQLSPRSTAVDKTLLICCAKNGLNVPAQLLGQDCVVRAHRAALLQIIIHSCCERPYPLPPGLSFAVLAGEQGTRFDPAEWALLLVVAEALGDEGAAVLVLNRPYDGLIIPVRNLELLARIARKHAAALAGRANEAAMYPQALEAVKNLTALHAARQCCREVNSMIDAFHSIGALRDVARLDIPQESASSATAHRVNEFNVQRIDVIVATALERSTGVVSVCCQFAVCDKPSSLKTYLDSWRFPSNTGAVSRAESLWRVHELAAVLHAFAQSRDSVSSLPFQDQERLWNGVRSVARNLILAPRVLSETVAPEVCAVRDMVTFLVEALVVWVELKDLADDQNIINALTVNVPQLQNMSNSLARYLKRMNVLLTHALGTTERQQQVFWLSMYDVEASSLDAAAGTPQLPQVSAESPTGLIRLLMYAARAAHFSKTVNGQDYANALIATTRVAAAIPACYESTPLLISLATPGRIQPVGLVPPSGERSCRLSRLLGAVTRIELSLPQLSHSSGSLFMSLPDTVRAWVKSLVSESATQLRTEATTENLCLLLANMLPRTLQSNAFRSLVMRRGALRSDMCLQHVMAAAALSDAALSHPETDQLLPIVKAAFELVVRKPEWLLPLCERLKQDQRPFSIFFAANFWIHDSEVAEDTSALSLLLSMQSICMSEAYKAAFVRARESPQGFDAVFDQFLKNSPDFCRKHFSDHSLLVFRQSCNEILLVGKSEDSVTGFQPVLQPYVLRDVTRFLLRVNSILKSSRWQSRVGKEGWSELRPNQVIALMASLGRAAQEIIPMKFSGVVAEIGTGQGKSLITCLEALYFALCGKNVAIMTSTEDLAGRDSREQNTVELCEEFGVTVACANLDSPQGSKPCYSSNHGDATKSKTIVFGASNFVFDYLRHTFLRESTMDGWQDPQTKVPMLDVVIIDECDYQLIDLGSSQARLSSVLPGFDELLVVHAAMALTKSLAVSSAANSKAATAVSVPVAAWMLQRLVDSDVTRLYLAAGKKGNPEDLVSKIHKELCDEKESFESIDKANEVARRVAEKHGIGIEQPIQDAQSNSLADYVDRQWSVWDKSLDKAINLRRDHHFDVDEAAMTLRPIDAERTGTVMKNIRWAEALHAFAQFLSGLRMDTDTPVANFCSYSAFVNKFSHVIGHTGSVGTEQERTFFQENFYADSMIVPNAHPEVRRRARTILTTNRAEWKWSVALAALTTASAKRAVLVVCNSIRDAEDVYGVILKIVAEQTLVISKSGDAGTAATESLTISVTPYFRNDNSGLGLPKKKVSRGDIIVATNLCSRGVDLNADDVDARGGLHVVLAYVASNRQRKQVYGRTGRQGNQGSYQCIAMVAVKMEGCSLAEAEKEVDDRGDEQVARDIAKRQCVTDCDKCFSDFSAALQLLTDKVDAACRSVYSPQVASFYVSRVRESTITEFAIVYSEVSTLASQVEKPGDEQWADALRKVGTFIEGMRFPQEVVPAAGAISTVTAAVLHRFPVFSLVQAPQALRPDFVPNRYLQGTELRLDVLQPYSRLMLLSDLLLHDNDFRDVEELLLSVGRVGDKDAGATHCLCALAKLRMTHNPKGTVPSAELSARLREAEVGFDQSITAVNNEALSLEQLGRQLEAFQPATARQFFDRADFLKAVNKNRYECSLACRGLRGLVTLHDTPEPGNATTVGAIEAAELLARRTESQPVQMTLHDMQIIHSETRTRSHVSQIVSFKEADPASLRLILLRCSCSVISGNDILLSLLTYDEALGFLEGSRRENRLLDILLPAAAISKYTVKIQSFRSKDSVETDARPERSFHPVLAVIRFFQSTHKAAVGFVNDEFSAGANYFTIRIVGAHTLVGKFGSFKDEGTSLVLSDPQYGIWEWMWKDRFSEVAEAAFEAGVSVSMVVKLSNPAAAASLLTEVLQLGVGEPEVSPIGEVHSLLPQATRQRSARDIAEMGARGMQHLWSVRRRMLLPWRRILVVALVFVVQLAILIAVAYGTLGLALPFALRVFLPSMIHDVSTIVLAIKTGRLDWLRYLSVKAVAATFSFGPQLLAQIDKSLAADISNFLVAIGLQHFITPNLAQLSVDTTSELTLSSIILGGSTLANLSRVVGPTLMLSFQRLVELIRGTRIALESTWKEEIVTILSGSMTGQVEADVEAKLTENIASALAVETPDTVNCMLVVAERNCLDAASKSDVCLSIQKDFAQYFASVASCGKEDPLWTTKAADVAASAARGIMSTLWQPFVREALNSLDEIVKRSSQTMLSTAMIAPDKRMFGVNKTCGRLPPIVLQEREHRWAHPGESLRCSDNEKKTLELWKRAVEEQTHAARDEASALLERVRYGLIACATRNLDIEISAAVATALRSVSLIVEARLDPTSLPPVVVAPMEERILSRRLALMTPKTLEQRSIVTTTGHVDPLEIHTESGASNEEEQQHPTSSGTFQLELLKLLAEAIENHVCDAHDKAQVILSLTSDCDAQDRDDAVTSAKVALAAIHAHDDAQTSSDRIMLILDEMKKIQLVNDALQELVAFKQISSWNYIQGPKALSHTQETQMFAASFLVAKKELSLTHIPADPGALDGKRNVTENAPLMWTVPKTLLVVVDDPAQFKLNEVPKVVDLQPWIIEAEEEEAEEATRRANLFEEVDGRRVRHYKLVGLICKKDKYEAHVGSEHHRLSGSAVLLVFNDTGFPAQPSASSLAS